VVSALQGLCRSFWDSRAFWVGKLEERVEESPM
jgi:hypothetical protein